MTERKLHQKFLDRELVAETEEFEKKFTAQALYLLNQTEELFIGQFLAFKNGEMIVQFRLSRAFPRKGEYLQAMYIPADMQDYKQWGQWTYEHLFKNRLKGTEAVCIWQSRAREEGFVLLGFRGIDTDFAMYISEAPGALIVFGPHVPPIGYLSNLYKLSQNTDSIGAGDIFDYEYKPSDNKPILIREKDAATFIGKQMNLSPVTTLQGPPGTGKTQLIAELCLRFCEGGKSVLVTALTNRALMEVASKRTTSDLLEKGKIYKSNMTADEEDEEPRLKPLREIKPMKGSLVLSTFYITSGFAAAAAEDGVFDVVIMDEASQALIAMFAATRKIGTTNLWVGDTAQFGPVVAMNKDRIRKYGFSDFINGFQTVTAKHKYPVYQLTHTYRLTQRAADYTGFFYGGTLVSAKEDAVTYYPSLCNLLDRDGGPALVLTDMDRGDPTPQYAMDLATFIVHAALKDNPNVDMALLTCLRQTTRALQKFVSLRLGIGNRLLIDTVARSQGLTTDVAIYFIPNCSYLRTIEPHLFNVATSRAREHTIIIADKDILEHAANPIVHQYIERLHKERSLYISASNNNRKILETP